MAKRKVRGRDWHAWAFFANEDDWYGLAHYAEAQPGERPIQQGKWVRVKFVPVDPVPKAPRRGGEGE